MVGFLLWYIISSLFSVLFTAFIIFVIVAATRNAWKEDGGGIVEEMKTMGASAFKRYTKVNDDDMPESPNNRKSV